MKKLRFALIGDGAIAKYHRKAIEHVGGELFYVVDPKFIGQELNHTVETRFGHLESLMLFDGKIYGVDVFIIASPSYWHYHQIKYILSNSDAHIICEKPAFLPWEPIIDSDKLNIVLQLRYLPDLPERADLVKATFVRDEAYFKSWKGDPRKTGGLFFSLFIHYIDLAIQLGADFEGMVLSEGEQERFILREQAPKGQWDIDRKIDILNIDSQTCYNRLYEDVISGGGIKPKDIFYLNWVLQRNSELFGYGRNGLNKLIKIGKELL